MLKKNGSVETANVSLASDYYCDGHIDHGTANWVVRTAPTKFLKMAALQERVHTSVRAAAQPLFSIQVILTPKY